MSLAAELALSTKQLAHQSGHAITCADAFRQSSTSVLAVGDWTFLTTHGQALLLIANDPEVRLRDIAVSLGVTERTAFGIVADLTEAEYVLKERDGRRNRYTIQTHLPLRDAIVRERTVGEVLALLGDVEPQRRGRSARS